jgi:hypothetical protein
LSALEDISREVWCDITGDLKEKRIKVTVIKASDREKMSILWLSIRGIYCVRFDQFLIFFSTNWKLKRKSDEAICKYTLS